MTVPPSIQALLAARLDALASNERSVIEPASVVGYHFPAAALGVLVPDPLSETVGEQLVPLEAKHLVRRLEDGEEGAHRFDHIMIRDTAYDGVLNEREPTCTSASSHGPTSPTRTAGPSSRRSSATTWSRPATTSLS